LKKYNFYVHLFLFFLIYSELKSLPQGGVADDYEHLAKKDIPRGKLFNQKKQLKLSLRHKATLRTKNAGFMQKQTNFFFKDNLFWAMDGASSDIHIFENNGDYKKKIIIKPGPVKISGFPTFRIGPNGNFFIHNAAYKASEILEVDLTGQIVKRYSTHFNNDKTNIEIASRGLVVSSAPHGKRIFTRAFQWLPLKNILKETMTIASFKENGHLLKIFAPYHPFYVKYELTDWRMIDLTMYKGELYSLQSALPYVQVYSLDGKLKRQFGIQGYFQKPIKKQPVVWGPGKEPFWRKHTSYFSIRIIPESSLGEPVVAVSYYNPELEPVEGLETHQETHNNYLMFYSLSGKLLYNSLELPGRLYSVTEQHELLLLENAHPLKLKLGLYSLKLNSINEKEME